ncbi:MAG: DUF2892 domain-containing protein [Cocleimonas sp.]
MTISNAVTAFAGVMIIISLLLTHYVHPNFVWFTVFIGFNLFQQSFTGFCPAAMIFKAMGLKNS